MEVDKLAETWQGFHVRKLLHLLDMLALGMSGEVSDMTIQYSHVVIGFKIWNSRISVCVLLPST